MPYGESIELSLPLLRSSFVQRLVNLPNFIRTISRRNEVEGREIVRMKFGQVERRCCTADSVLT